MRTKPPSPYLALKNAGLSPLRITQALHADGLDRIACIKTLRQLLDISVADARELVDGTSMLPASPQQVSAQSQDESPISNQQQQGIIGLIEHLQKVRARPAAYIGPHIHTLHSYLQGLTVGFMLACGIPEQSHHESSYAIHRQRILQNRGWPERNWHLVQIMSGFGYPYDAIAQEVLTIEIDAWKQTAQRKP